MKYCRSSYAAGEAFHSRRCRQSVPEN